MQDSHEEYFFIGIDAIRTWAISVKEKYLYAMQHAKPVPLLLSPQRLLARSAVALVFTLRRSLCAHAVKGKATINEYYSYAMH